MKTFSVIEYSSFYAIRHNESGEEHPMGDGVDTLIGDDCRPISPATPGFREMWEDSLNTSEGVLECYFPHLVED